jgi:serine/threonine-protein kinase
MIGQTVGGYKIVELIGRGGWAEVYKAYDASVDRHVAIKVLHKQYSEDVELRIRFDREARAIALLEHLHILPLYSYGEQDGMLYLAMRYMPYGTIADRVVQNPLMLGEVSRLLTQISAALDYAHGQGVLHRDLKPENVLMDGENNAYLSDFGLAKIAQTSSRLTMNYIIGTPAFMSPEQCLGDEDLSPQSDQYALGLMLYTMVTGELAFDGPQPLKVIQMQLNQPLPSPRLLRADLPELAERAMFRATSKDPETRYPTCMDLARDFEQSLGGKGLSEGIPQNLRRRIDSALGKLQLEDHEE